MSKAPVDLARGAGVSYQSTHWLLASFRAAKNKHFLLSLVTFGTFLAQARKFSLPSTYLHLYLHALVIISMSALFELNTGLIDSHVTLNRSLELRNTPHVRLQSETYPPNFHSSRRVFGFDYVSSTLEELFTNLTTNWMYSAVIEATLDGSQPPWSKDGWSFVPIDLSNLENMKETYHNNDPKTNAVFTNYSPVNVTMSTPAIRARLECSPTADVLNTTWWLEPNNYTDSRTNKSKVVNNVKYVWGFTLPTVNYSTPLAPDAQTIQCCFNQTDPSRVKDWSMPLAVGYWTVNYGEGNSVTGDNGNFTVKWVFGEGGFPDYYSSSLPPIMFPSAPKLQSLNCMPIMETSEAEITVDKQTGRVQSYKILKDPAVDDSAWSDNFVFHTVNNPDDAAFKVDHNAWSDDFVFYTVNNPDDAAFKAESSPDLEFDDYVSARQNMTTRYVMQLPGLITIANRAQLWYSLHRISFARFASRIFGPSYGSPWLNDYRRPR